jgi:hypothetical protein
MSTRRTLPRVAYDGRLMAEDAAAKGLEPRDLVNTLRGHVSQRTIYRFLSNDVQSGRTAKLLAEAIGHDVSRYVIRSRSEAIAS